MVSKQKEGGGLMATALVKWVQRVEALESRLKNLRQQGVNKIPWILREGRGRFQPRGGGNGIIWLASLYNCRSLTAVGMWGDRTALEARRRDRRMSLQPERANVPGDAGGWIREGAITRRDNEGNSRYLKVPEASPNTIIFPSEWRRKALFLFWALDGGGVNGSWQLSLPSEA